MILNNIFKYFKTQDIDIPILLNFFQQISLGENPIFQYLFIVECFHLNIFTLKTDKGKRAWEKKRESRHDGGQ